jgi:hypothetical protein
MSDSVFDAATHSTTRTTMTAPPEAVCARSCFSRKCRMQELTTLVRELKIARTPAIQYWFEQAFRDMMTHPGPPPTPEEMARACWDEGGIHVRRFAPWIAALPGPTELAAQLTVDELAWEQHTLRSSCRIIAHEDGGERRPPNKHDINIYLSAPGMINLAGARCCCQVSS